jgi:large subunit ribosomal protein L4
MADVYSLDGTKTGSVDLDPEVFDVDPNQAVMHQVVTAQLAAARSGSANTKTRAEVRGGGAKPWRQKGTGRARQGSIRSPQWTGGGVVHGPKPRSYAQRTPKKMIRLALRSALSDRARGARIKVLEDYAFDVPSTKAARGALDALSLEGRTLVVISEWEADETAVLSFRNLPTVHIIPGDQLNTYDVLRSDWVLFSRASLETATGKAKP